MIDTASSAPALSPATAPQVKVWDLPLRLFHWLLAISVLLAFVSAEEGSGLGGWHFTAGWVAAILIGFRLLWGFIGGQHARFANFVRPDRLGQHLRELLRGRVEPSLGHNPLGGLATLLLLAAVAAVVWTGVGMIGGNESGEELHEGLANGLLVLIGVHVVGVIVMSLLSRENLAAAMVTGKKRRSNHPGAVDATPPAAVAVPLAAVAIAAGTYAVLQVDAAAFASGARTEAGDRDHDGDDD